MKTYRYRIAWLALVTALLYWGLTYPAGEHAGPLPQLDEGWKWHKGDDPSWASPAFDDSKWEAINPAQDVMHLPQIHDGQILWLRSRLTIDTALLGESRALHIFHVGASEVYLNGQLVRRFGTLNASSVKAGFYVATLGFPTNRSQVVIAVRCAFQKGLPYNRFGSVPNFFFNTSLISVEGVEKFYRNFIGPMMVFACTKIGAFLLLFLLHFALYIFYPAQKANLFFSGMALCYGIHILLWALFVAFKLTGNLSLLLYAGLLRGPIYTLTYTLLLRAFYALFDYKPDFVFWSTVACNAFLLIPFFVDYEEGIRYAEVWTTNVSALACFYVAIKALMDQKRYALLIFCGMVLSTVALEGRYLIEFFKILPRFHKTQIPGLLDFFGAMSIPICISWALAKNFAHINRSLAARLVEVQQLALEKQQLLISQNENLERQVAERTREIEEQSRLLEQQHIRQLELSFEQKLAETEMTALRSQMNPHFIFNCLNSIKLYATENDSDKAAEYLTKFSRLIRKVLENSRSERVTLENELDALRLYLEMEAMRFKDKLRFEIEVEPGIDAEFTEIPPLLIQPYVENAIWHGLMHKPEGGTVSVTVGQPHPDHLRITVADDGVGRAKAAELKSKSATPKKSFGLKVTGERIALINQLYQTHTRVQIHDLTDPEGHPAGTEVVLEIPI